MLLPVRLTAVRLVYWKAEHVAGGFWAGQPQDSGQGQQRAGQCPDAAALLKGLRCEAGPLQPQGSACMEHSATYGDAGVCNCCKPAARSCGALTLLMTPHTNDDATESMKQTARVCLAWPDCMQERECTSHSACVGLKGCMVTWDDPALHGTDFGFRDAGLAWLADRLVSKSWQSRQTCRAAFRLLHTAAAWPQPNWGSLSMTEPVSSMRRLFLYNAVQRACQPAGWLV